MRFWANLLGYQVVWFLVAWSAGAQRAWIGIGACLVFIAVQWRASRVRAADTRALLVAFGCGLLIDGAMAASGWVQYASPQPGLPAPLWIVALWGAFALTLNHSMAWFGSRLWIAAGFAAIGGPLAYLGAARAFDALAFREPAWQTLAVLGLAWAVAPPLLLRIAAPGGQGQVVPASEGAKA